MDFGEAIRALKQGKRVARKGWNGKGMWIAMTPSSQFAAACARDGHAAKHRANELASAGDQHGVITLGAHIDMRAVDGTLVIGWLASQTDMLAEDWGVIGTSDAGEETFTTSPARNPSKMVWDTAVDMDWFGDAVVYVDTPAEKLLTFVLPDGERITPQSQEPTIMTADRGQVSPKFGDVFKKVDGGIVLAGSMVEV